MRSMEVAWEYKEMWGKATPPQHFGKEKVDWLILGLLFLHAGGGGRGAWNIYKSLGKIFIVIVYSAKPRNVGFVIWGNMNAT